MRPTLILSASVIALAACSDGGFDLDLRDVGRGFDTTAALPETTAPRPQPDARGVISYPNYQVAVARRGDRVSDVATRVGLPVDELARYNGVPPDAVLNQGEILALPRRVAEPSPATGAAGFGPIMPTESVDIQTLAGGAIDRATPAASPTPAAVPAPPVQTGQEPVRHKVEAGETAYSISRLYGVSVKALGDWNGLGPDMTVRTGQYLLIPVAAEPAPRREAAATTQPGQGTPTPVPPSATEPLPEEKTEPVANTTPAGSTPKVTGTPASPDLGKDATASSRSRMAFPVEGSVIRDFRKGKNDGIDIGATSGAPVRAAADGTVAAITQDTDQVPIIVLRHDGGLLTVYANVDKLKIKKGETVRRGQAIAEVRAADSPYLHFEVRDGVEAVDPSGYLN